MTSHKCNHLILLSLILPSSYIKHIVSIFIPVNCNVLSYNMKNGPFFFFTKKSFLERYNNYTGVVVCSSNVVIFLYMIDGQRNVATKR